MFLKIKSHKPFQYPRISPLLKFHEGYRQYK
jgi:hypothetical protein